MTENSWLGVFPELSSCVLEIQQYDIVTRANTPWRSIQPGNQPWPCRNNSCRRGGFRFTSFIQEMVDAGLKTKDGTVFCHGRERIGGSYRDCVRNVGVRCTVEYKGTIS